MNKIVNGDVVEMTPEEVAAREAEEAAPVTTEERKAQIRAELASLDTRRIRPTAEGDAAFLAGLNAQSVALRAELAELED